MSTSMPHPGLDCAIHYNTDKIQHVVARSTEGLFWSASLWHVRGLVDKIIVDNIIILSEDHLSEV